MAKDSKTLKEELKGLLKEAKEKGFDSDASFLTTYHMTETQVDMLDDLEKAYKEDGTTITKEYVKGRENIYIHPAIKEYTKISDSAFNKIIKMKEMMNKYSNSGNDTEDELDDFLND